jgi:threonylcarbamoyladenosine tRNA methylthiotransferase MtaB
MCDKTLDKMGRKYLAKEAMDVIKKLQVSFKTPPFLGCDVITGFPDESDEDFEITYQNLKRAKLSKIHVFPYSKRKGTLAEKMPEQVQDCVKTARAKKLAALSENLYKDFIDKNLDLEHEILFEKKPKDKTLNCGITKNYIKVFVKCDDDLRGEIQNIKLKDVFKIGNAI